MTIIKWLGPALFRTFLVFFVGGLLMTTAVISLFLIGEMVWLDCFHDNPDLVCGDALLLAVVSPLYGVTIGMAVNFLPLIAAAALAVLGRAVFRHLPLWYVIAILPACVLAYAAQASSWLPHTEMRPLSERLLMFTAFQIPTLLICWWWDRRA
jgi:hypothetical protein